MWLKRLAGAFGRGCVSVCVVGAGVEGRGVQGKPQDCAHSGPASPPSPGPNPYPLTPAPPPS